MSTNSKVSGQFDQSFMFHMIKDFFLLAMVVAVVELGIHHCQKEKVLDHVEHEGLIELPTHL